MNNFRKWARPLIVLAAILVTIMWNLNSGESRDRITAKSTDILNHAEKEYGNSKYGDNYKEIPRNRRVRHIQKEPNNLHKQIETLQHKYADFLKKMELARVSGVKTYEGSEFASSYSYEISIDSPTRDEINKWNIEKSLMTEEFDPELRQQIAIKLAEVQADFELRESSVRRVSFDVPHDRSSKITYSEYFILDLKSGKDSKYPSASILPSGIVHSLLRKANLSADPASRWRYDHILKLAPEQNEIEN